MKIPKPISNLIDSFERLPGIGPKTAQRLVFHLLHFPSSDIERFAEALLKFKANTKLCKICKNVGEEEICLVCSDYTRDKSKIAVVSSSLDAFSLERTGYKGLYHVLHGLIDPLNGLGPEDIFLYEVLDRIKDHNFALDGILEVILATNTSMEGEATAMFISKAIRDAGLTEDKVTISRIARGLPVGGDIEYADDITLSRALEGRSKF